MARPSFDSLRINPRVGRDMILFKQAQAGMPGSGGLPPEVGQSPVTGNPDEMQAPESANQSQFEDDFGSLAYQFANDRAAALIPYMLGFEVVDRNEDGSKAVGIFGYKVDDDFYYIPAFFLNNQVRGMDMILNKKTNQFVPLTEKWIDFIVNKHSIRIGSPASDEVRETMRNPDLSFVQRPQAAMGKMGSAQNGAPEEPWTSQEAWAHIKEATARLVEDPGFQEMLSGVLAKGAVEKAAESKYVKDFMEKVGGPECMTRFLRTLHDVGFANAALSLYKDAEAFWTEKLAGAAIHVDRMKKLAAAQPKVRVVASTQGLAKVAQDAPAADVGGDAADKPLTVEENARQIVEHDFTIEDTRPDDQAAQVTDDSALVDFEHRFNPPDGPGAYNFMMADGLSRKGTLLNAVLSPYCGKKNTLIVFEDDGHILAEACPKALITTDESPDETDGQGGSGGVKDAFKELFNKAKSFSEIEVGLPDQKRAQADPAPMSDSAYRDGRPYLFIDDKGNAAGPFFIKFALADGDHIRFATGYGSSSDVIFETHAPDGLSETYGFMDWNLKDRHHDEDGNRADNRSCDCECGVCDSNTMISIGTFSGLPKKTGEGIIIPHDWKALPLRMFPRWLPYDDKLTQAERDKRDAEAKKLRTEKQEMYTFGNALDILEEMKSEGVSRIKVACDGTDYAIVMDGAKRRHGPFGYKEAAVELVTRFGFRPRRAFDVLAKSASAGDVILLAKIPSLAKKTVKQAQDALVNVAMPAPQEQLPSIDPYSGVPVYQSPYIDMTQGQFTGVPGLPPEGGMTRGINVGGEMERAMGSGEYPDEHRDAMGEGALPIDEEARRLAEDAAKAGQRHVFDQAAIGGLVKVFDTANVVDSYIPDFMDTIDRLGRILFLFYWKHEDFNQRYGSDDVVQMEDHLRNVFKQLGELTLSLKEKSVHKE